MKKTLFSIYSILFVFILIFTLTGCVCSNRAEYPEEELVIYSGIDGAAFYYSNKVQVRVHNDKGKYMIVTLKPYENDKEWKSTYGYEVFNDLKYKYFTWHNYYLYIQTVDDVYYSLDIKGYKPGEFVDSKKKTPKYTLKEYTADEFKELHPDYETYEWVDG